MRRRNRNLRHIQQPKLATHFPSLSRGEALDRNAFMFSQDIPLAIMPIGGRTEKRQAFAISFDGDEKDCESAKNTIASLGKFDRYGDNELVSDAVENIAQRMAWDGEAAFEIVRDESDGSVWLSAFQPRRLMTLFGWVIQFIPSGDWSLWKRKLSIARSKDLWIVQIPQALGGQTNFKRAISKLRGVDNLGPAFWRKDLELSKLDRNFEFQEYVRTVEAFYARTVRIWGWNRRDSSQKFSTEFFLIYRALTFRWAQAILREHILNELNHLLRRLKLQCTMTIKGLPSPEEVLRAREGLVSGTLSFNAAIEATSI